MTACSDTPFTAVRSCIEPSSFHVSSHQAPIIKTVHEDEAGESGTTSAPPVLLQSSVTALGTTLLATTEQSQGGLHAQQGLTLTSFYHTEGVLNMASMLGITTASNVSLTGAPPQDSAGNTNVLPLTCQQGGSDARSMLRHVSEQLQMRVQTVSELPPNLSFLALAWLSGTSGLPPCTVYSTEGDLPRMLLLSVPRSGPSSTAPSLHESTAN